MIRLILCGAFILPLGWLNANGLEDDIDLNNEIDIENELENDIELINDLNNANYNFLNSQNFDSPLDINVDTEKTERMDVKPERRSSDYEEAFQELQRGNPYGNIYAIVDGISYDNIIDVRATSNGTLLVVKTRNYGYEEEHIFKVEDIDQMSLRKSTRGSRNIRFPSGW